MAKQDRSVPPRSDPWRELEHLLHFGELERLSEELAALAPELGISTGQLERLRRADGEQLASRLRDLSGQRRSRGRAARACTAEGRARRAADELRRSAVACGDTLEVDAAVLLGDLPAHPTAKLIAFVLPEVEPIYVTKMKLLAARRVLKGFSDTKAYLDARVSIFGGVAVEAG